MMSFRLSSLIARPVAIALSLATLATISGFGAAYSQGMGPVNPADYARPKQDNPNVDAMKNTLGKWFGQRSRSAKEGEELEVVEQRKGAGMPGQFDMVKVHKRKADIAAEEAERQAEELDGDEMVQNAIDNIEKAETKQSRPSRPPLLAQPPLENPEIAMPMVESNNPPEKMPALDSPTNPFGLTSAEKQLNETALMIEQGRFSQAEQQLNPLKEWLVQSTEAHIELYKALNKIPSAEVQSELEKQVALEFGQMRDKALFQLARIHQNKNDNMSAIKLYVEVIKSQPSSQIGLESYKHLQEMGFTQKLQLVAQ